VNLHIAHEQAEIADYLTEVYAAENAILAHPLCTQVQTRAGALDWAALPAGAFTRLNLWRTRASDTLRHGDETERKGWDQANALIAQLLAQDVPLGFAFGAKLHHALGFADSAVRSERLYTADEEYLRPEYVGDELARLEQVLNGPANPLVRAFAALVGMVTIHPFSNGNGRTSRMLADAVLISAGYLPLSFAFPIASHVGRTTRGVPRAVDEAIDTFLGGLLNSYDVVLAS
jgi:Fic/DOC family